MDERVRSSLRREGAIVHNDVYSQTFMRENDGLLTSLQRPTHLEHAKAVLPHIKKVEERQSTKRICKGVVTNQGS